MSLVPAPGAATTADDFLKLCKGHRHDAVTLLAHGTTNGAWFHVGLAVECCLKAAIIQQERWNAWPQKEASQGLYTHDLLRLFRMLGVEPYQFDTSNPVAPALKTILDWRRDHGYSRHGVPKKVAEALSEAAFGGDGVIEWLATNYRLDI